MHSNPKQPHPEYDGPPEGFEADWLKWRSRCNRRDRFRQQAPKQPKPEKPATQGANDAE